MNANTTTNANRLAGETDDRGGMVRRYLDELRRESVAKGGLEGILAALRGPERGRYRAAVRHAAAGVLQYSGRGYPAAGLEVYGPEVDVADVPDDAYEQARRLIDELDLIAVERGLDDVIEAMRTAGNYTFPPQHRQAVALELVRTRRARRQA